MELICGPVSRAETPCVVQLLLEEFGKWMRNGTAASQAQRDAFYTLVYDAIHSVSLLPSGLIETVAQLA